MERTPILETIRKLCVEILDVEGDKVVEAANFVDDLDADSLALVELVMALEDEFSIEIPEEDLDGVDTVGKAVDLVVAKLA